MTGDGSAPRFLVREEALEAMAAEPVDIAVVGGGITGCGVARDAALRGLKVALVEQEDFGFGTSSRSSKIIHGGVRYLEQFQLLLVRESATERKILQRIAPHLVHEIPFHYPVFDRDSYWKVRAGLAVFDILAGSRGRERSTGLDAAETRRALPGLRGPLAGSVRYPEFITDDARFTLENILSAIEHGALAANHARVTGLLRKGKRVAGISVEDRLTGKSHEVRAKAVVNATGPWAEEFLEEVGCRIPKSLVPSKGIHILLPADRLPILGATFLRSRAGRRGLAMRRGEWVYVGTSDDEYRGDLNRPRANRSEVNELLEMTRDCFPEAGLEPHDVKATWAGIRPLILQKGKSTRDMSREDEIWIGPPGLVTVAGGKLTTYRKMGERVLRAVARTVEGPIPGGGATARIALPGAIPREGAEHAAPEQEIEALADRGVRAATLERLRRLFGSQLTLIRRMGDEDSAWLRPLGDGVPALRAEVRLAVGSEMATTLSDFMDRRSALLLFAPEHGLKGANEASRIMATMLGWSEERRSSELAEYGRLVEEHGLPEDRTKAADTA